MSFQAFDPPARVQGHNMEVDLAFGVTGANG